LLQKLSIRSTTNRFRKRIWLGWLS
jgi:hypothetical protein